MKIIVTLFLLLITNFLVAQVNLGKDIVSNQGSIAATIAYQSNIGSEKKLSESTKVFHTLYDKRNQTALSSVIALRIEKKLQRTKKRYERLVSLNRTIITSPCNTIKYKNTKLLKHILLEIKTQENIFRNQSTQMLVGTKTRIFLTAKEALAIINRRLDFVENTIFHAKNIAEPCR